MPKYPFVAERDDAVARKSLMSFRTIPEWERDINEWCQKHKISRSRFLERAVWHGAIEAANEIVPNSVPKKQKAATIRNQGE